MSKYVEDGYSDGYTEGDSFPSSVPTNCDLTAVINELALIKAQNVELNNKLDTVLNSISNNNTLNLSIVDKASDIQSKINVLDTKVNNIPTVQVTDLVDFSEFATKEFILSKVPFVDDKSIKVYPEGKKVSVVGVDGYCTVMSSQFLPYEAFTYFIIYTVSQIVDGVAKISTFPANQVAPWVEPVDEVI